MRKKLLIMTDWFCPGYKAGGMISACYHLSRLLKEDYSIYILTSDRDLGDASTYPGIIPNEWNLYDQHVLVNYLSPNKLTFHHIQFLIKELRPDHIYMNSMFSLPFTIYPMLQKKMGLIHSAMFLSPSGMLKNSALQQKSLKKKIFLRMLNLLHIQQLVTFHATSDQEKEDITHVFGKSANIHCIQLPSPVPDPAITFPVKELDSIRIAFVGRVHPIKNLHFLLESLSAINKQVQLTIIGPIEDKAYYHQCQTLEEKLPANINIVYTGGIPHNQIKQHLMANHFLVLPTSGENFCYAITESLCAGRPVIISDQTPWKDIQEKKAGWIFPLHDGQLLTDILNQAIGMSQAAYDQYAQAAWSYACVSIQRGATKEAYIAMMEPQPQLIADLSLSV